MADSENNKMAAPRSGTFSSGCTIFTGFDPSVLKEPRGILKPIEWVLSIFAFATTTSVTLKMSFDVQCLNDTMTFALQSGYPFSLEDEGLKGSVCNSTIPVDLPLLQGSSSPAQFYVFVGVMVFLYCLAALVLYILCDEFYRKHTNVVIADFIISVVIVIMWLIASSAWAQGVSDLKYYTDLADCGYLEMIPDCGSVACVQNVKPNFASLNVSILFGFLNMCVWAGNLWFLFKETPWHKVQQTKPPTIPGQETQSDPQRI